MQKLVFTIAVTLISRVFVLRDTLLGRLRPAKDVSGVQVSRQALQTGAHVLDCVFVAPVESPKAALLICHGIGEVVENWLPAQQLLALHGVASLVFDYTGYGKSGGTVDWLTCEQNAVSAFSFLRTLAPDAPISLLGFSMGSGIANAIVDQVSPVRLILCSAFTSFRDAACVLGLPRLFAIALPPIWSAREILSNRVQPVLIVHCERDRAFPVRMARELQSFCGRNAELVIVPGQAHNEPFYQPKLSFWGHLLDRIIPEDSPRPRPPGPFRPDALVPDLLVGKIQERSDHLTQHPL